jgi:hypothetical protein
VRSAITTIDPETINIAMIEFAALFDALLMLMLGAMFC